MIRIFDAIKVVRLQCECNHRNMQLELLGLHKWVADVFGEKKFLARLFVGNQFLVHTHKNSL